MTDWQTEARQAWLKAGALPRQPQVGMADQAATRRLADIESAIGNDGINELLANSPFDNAEYANGRISGNVSTTDAVRSDGVWSRRGRGVTAEAFFNWLRSDDAVFDIADADYLDLVRRARGVLQSPEFAQ